jgi:hypothetical protein
VTNIVPGSSRAMQWERLDQKAEVASTETTDSHRQGFPSKWHTQSVLSLPFPMHKLLTIKVTKNIL